MVSIQLNLTIDYHTWFYSPTLGGTQPLATNGPTLDKELARLATHTECTPCSHFIKFHAFESLYIDFINHLYSLSQAIVTNRGHMVLCLCSFQNRPDSDTV